MAAGRRARSPGIEDAWADGSWGRYHGPHCGKLERELARLHEVDFVTLVCSGTFAVELALRGLGIARGDEVILAGYDFPGNFRAIEAIGARVALVDVEPDGWLLDLDQLPAAVGEHTRAIVVSHLHGGMADMPRLMDFAARHSLAVVEDACQSPGAIVSGRVAGSWGDVGVLSFGGSKLLTAGRGGAATDAQRRRSPTASKSSASAAITRSRSASCKPPFCCRNWKSWPSVMPFAAQASSDSLRKQPACRACGPL